MKINQMKPNIISVGFKTRLEVKFRFIRDPTAYGLGSYRRDAVAWPTPYVVGPLR
jgi:hypothetical protein